MDHLKIRIKVINGTIIYRKIILDYERAKRLFDLRSSDNDWLQNIWETVKTFTDEAVSARNNFENILSYILNSELDPHETPDTYLDAVFKELSGLEGKTGWHETANDLSSGAERFYIKLTQLEPKMKKLTDTLSRFVYDSL